MSIDPRLLFLARRTNEVRDRLFPGRGIRIADIGCADGAFMEAVSSSIAGVEADGIDAPTPWLLREPAERRGRLFIQDLQLGTGVVPEGSYHIATMWEVIEHIENAYGFLGSVKKILAPGGILLLSTPNLTGLSRFVKGGRWVGVAEKDHRHLFDALSISMLLEKAGFSEVRARSYFFPSLGKRMDRMNRIASALPFGGMVFAEARKSEAVSA
ncbi:MAG: class I SAM-dependent methyltransferase [Deltaproteobacteria bacterium]|nr:class I SAM-dependent methyltransferase [Deltaproteobacteria bacterium]MCL4873330.1 methyltransferase domain-containing protein [bacterium]